MGHYNESELTRAGKRVVDLQTSLALLNAANPEMQSGQAPEPDKFGRTPFQHRSLGGLQNITESAKATELDKSRLANLGKSYGLANVIRWKPKNVSLSPSNGFHTDISTLTLIQTRNLAGSGIDVVLAHTVYAIVGAITLQNGAEVGNRIVKERVLNPLGL